LKEINKNQESKDD